MIGAQYYKPIYYIILVICTLISLSNIESDRERNEKKSTFLLCLFMILFIGLRPVSLKYFVDMYGTAMQFSLWVHEQVRFSFTEQNLIYDNLRINMATLGFSYTSFFLIIAAIYFGGIYYICCRIFRSNQLIAFVVCLSAFSAFSYATNGIKAGSAASVFLVAMALYHNDRKLISILVSILSIGFHHSMVLPVFAFIVCMLIKQDKIYFYIWVICLMLALLKVTYFQDLFATISSDAGNEHAAGYLTGIGKATKGFRIDFIIYSAVPIILGRWISYLGAEKSESYQYILNLYTLVNAIWMLCMYAEFTNRIAYLSWFMYPIVLIYPLLNEDYLYQDTRLMKIFVYGHLCFTLFLEFIYY